MENKQNIFEKHPIVTLMTFFVAGVTCASLILSLFFSSQISALQSQLDTFKSNFGNAEKTIGGSYKIDLSKILISKSEHIEFSDEMEYLPDMRLYYPKKIDGFDFRSITQFDVDNTYKKFVQDEIDLNKFVYEWYLDDMVSVEDNGVYKNMYTSVLFFSQNIDSIWNLGIVDSNGVVIPSEQIKDTAQVNSFKRNIYSDPLSLYFSDNLNSMLSISRKGRYSNNNYELLTVNKQGNIMYDHYLMTLYNIKIDGKFYDKFYVHIQEVCYLIDKQIMLISIFIPSKSPIQNDKQFYYVNNWLSRIKLIKD